MALIEHTIIHILTAGMYGNITSMLTGTLIDTIINILTGTLIDQKIYKEISYNH